MRILASLLALVAIGSGCAQTAVDLDEFVTSNSLRSLAQSSDLVVVGVVRGELGTRNMARRADDPLQPHPALVSLGQDYDVQIVDVLKGPAERSLVVSISKAMKVDDRFVTYRGFLPLQNGSRYVLFLRRQIDGTNGYVPAPEPWRFRLTTVAEAQSPWPDASRYFPTKDAEQFLTDVAAAVR